MRKIKIKMKKLASLDFLIDNQKQLYANAPILGVWNTANLAVLAGQHTFTWYYSQPAGAEDSAALSQVIVGGVSQGNSRVPSSILHLCVFVVVFCVFVVVFCVCVCHVTFSRYYFNSDLNCLFSVLQHTQSKYQFHSYLNPFFFFNKITKQQTQLEPHKFLAHLANSTFLVVRLHVCSVHLEHTET